MRAEYYGCFRRRLEPFQPGWGGGGAAEGMIIIANERFSLNCLPTIIFLSLFPSPSLRKTAAFISTPDHLGEYGWRGGWWLIYSEKLGWNIGISWRKGREAWRVSQSMGFASFCFVSEMSSLPPPHCVATSRWRGKILPGKEKGKVKRLKGGFGIWSWWSRDFGTFPRFACFGNASFRSRGGWRREKKNSRLSHTVIFLR